LNFPKNFRARFASSRKFIDSASKEQNKNI
jgi:hypothetical protein